MMNSADVTGSPQGFGTFPDRREAAVVPTRTIAVELEATLISSLNRWINQPMCRREVRVPVA